MATVTPAVEMGSVSLTLLVGEENESSRSLATSGPNMPSLDLSSAPNRLGVDAGSRTWYSVAGCQLTPAGNE